MSLFPVYEFGDPALDRWLDRSPAFNPDQVSSVTRIIAEVQREGESAVARHTRQFDSPLLENIFVQPDEFNVEIDPEDAASLDVAIERVRDFHHTQFGVITNDWEDLGDGTYGWRTSATESDDPGFEGQRLLPLERVGVYVPGGLAEYPSSVIMNVIPALEAGVKTVVVATPPRQDGTLPPAVLYVLKQLGVSTVLKAGGASAVAAMALGFEGFPRVDKIVGPGNSWVTEAKRQLWGTVGLDGYAGPSEVAVYVDDPDYVAFAAVDLLTQVEHAPDNVGMLLAPTRELLDKVEEEARRLLQDSPRRQTMEQALHDHGVAVVASESQAVETINRFAPEHLSLVTDNGPALAMQIRNCGCVLIGPYTPQSCGDFVSGPSHTLPTSGSARFGSPVNVQDFLKFQSISLLTAEDLALLDPHVARLGQIEGFPMHGQGASVRLDSSD